MKAQIRRHRFASTLLCLLLAACGGGGGGGNGGTITPPPPPPPPPPPAPPFQLLSAEPGNATIRERASAFAANGDGAVVWYANAGSGGALLMSTYDAATDAWTPDEIVLSFRSQDPDFDFAVAAGDVAIGIVYAVDGRQIFGSVVAGGVLQTPQLLDEVANPGDRLLRTVIASTGDGFAAGWVRRTAQTQIISRDEVIRGSVLDGGALNWTPASTLSSVGRVNGLTFESNGSGYLAAWAITDPTTSDNRLRASVYANGAWIPPGSTLEIVNFGGVNRPFAAASNGNGYQLAYVHVANGQNSAFARAIDANQVLGPAQTLEAIADPVQAISVVAGANDYLVAWSTSTTMYANVGASGSWSAETPISSLSGRITTARSATDGAGYAVVWVQDDVAGQGARPSVWASVYTGAWSAAELIETHDGSARGDGLLDLAHDGSDYVAAWTRRIDGSSSYDLWSNAFTAGSWGSAESIGQFGTDRSSDSEVRITLSGGNDRSFVTYAEQLGGPDGVAVNVARRNAGGWETAVNLAGLQTGSDVFLQDLLHNAAGQTLAVWEQQFGARHVTYAAVQSANGIWGSPEILRGLGEEERVRGLAASDTGFAAVFERETGVGSGSELAARVFDGQSWSVPTVISTGLTGRTQAQGLASNGSGFAAMLRRLPLAGDPSPQSMHVSVYENGAWGLPVQVDDGSAGSRISGQISSNGSGYAATWGDSDVVYEASVATFDGTSWSPQETLFSSTTFNSIRPRLSSNGSGYLVHWQAQDVGDAVRNVYAAVSASGTAADFGAAIRVSDDGAFVSDDNAASDGGGYALVWTTFPAAADSQILASVWDGSAWSTAEELDSNEFGLRFEELVAASGEYAAAWRKDVTDEFLPYATEVRIFANGAWGAPHTLFTQTVDRGFFEFDLDSNGTDFAATWVQALDEDARSRPWFASSSGGTWSSRALLTQDTDADDARLSRAGSGYSVLYTEPQPGATAVSSLPWVYDGLD